jgi:Na+/H+ antiporter NhaA
MHEFVPSGCDILQYADDIAVYSSHHVLQTACALVQMTCFFLLLGLTISSTKLKVVLFSRKHLRPPVLIQIGGKLLPQVASSKYLRVVFDAGLRWMARYVQKRCVQRPFF